MTGAVLLIVAVLFLAASIESLLCNWRDLRRTFRGLADDARAPLGHPFGSSYRACQGVVAGSTPGNVQTPKIVSQISLRGDR